MPLTPEQEARLNELESKQKSFARDSRIAELEAKQNTFDVEEGVGAFEAGARSLAEGVTLGFSEEIAGFVAKPFLSDEEEAQFEQDQEAQRLAGERKFGALTTGAELVGNIISGTSLALAGAAALPVTTALGATAATLGGGTALGITVGAGKTRAEFGSDRWDEDVALGGLFGLVAAPLGVTGGKVLKSAAQKFAQTKTAAGAGAMFRQYADKWSKAAAGGDLGPEAQIAAKEMMGEAVESQTKRAAERGTGVYGHKVLDDISEDALIETQEQITKKFIDPFKVRRFSGDKVGRSTSVGTTKDVVEDVAEEVAESIPGVGSLDINPAVASAQNELKIKALKAATRSGTKAQRSRAREALQAIKEEEKEFLQQISDDLPGALRGDLGPKAKSFADREVRKQIRKIDADEAAADAVLVNIFNKGAKKVQEKTTTPLKNAFQKFLDESTPSGVATSVLTGRGGIIKTPVQSAIATFRGGVPSAGRSAIEVGLEGSTSAVAASRFTSPTGGE